MQIVSETGEDGLDHVMKDADVSAREEYSIGVLCLYNGTL